MKLLICTQAVDSADSNLGFFVRWIEEFAKYYERIEVICLRAGEYSLPQNVQVHALHSLNKVGRTLELMVLCTRLPYDTVFVHMNPEYLVAGGWWWKILGKKIALWYTHKSVDMKLRIAEKFADLIFTASKESFRLPSKKVHVMGHGIDTDFFSPDPVVPRGAWLLSVGRLMKSKRHDLAIRRAKQEDRELRIAGEGPERASLEAIAHSLDAKVQFLGGLSRTRLRDEYRRAALLLHTSETGSLDKVTLEALACGLSFHTNDPALQALENVSPEYVQGHHSLKRLVPALVSEMQSL